MDRKGAGGRERQALGEKRRQGRGSLGWTVQDLQLSFRHWKRNPGFAAAAILTLALGIGAKRSIGLFYDRGAGSPRGQAAFLRRTCLLISTGILLIDFDVGGPLHLLDLQRGVAAVGDESFERLNLSARTSNISYATLSSSP